MSYQQISDPEGTFGRQAIPGSNRRSRIVETFRNASTVAIPRGAVVVGSTLSTDGLGVAVSTVVADPQIVGVAFTSASTGTTVGGSSVTPAGAWLEVVTKGPAEVIVSTAATRGDIVAAGNSTAFAGAGAGGAAAALTTAPGSGSHAALGRLLRASSDTNSTGQLGVVDVNISNFVTTA